MIWKLILFIKNVSGATLFCIYRNGAYKNNGDPWPTTFLLEVIISKEWAEHNQSFNNSWGNRRPSDPLYFMTKLNEINYYDVMNKWISYIWTADYEKINRNLTAVDSLFIFFRYI